ncbi:MAG: Methyl-accepting chemotaxis protein I (serine chemoreceptor protein) [uncultured Paraburkholderia sp.]|nr:MAG: Methyl-accepting chemotaxis protein I (serine chemoreceptor protein) [uncultured Paraburkholderia sp.]
MNFSQLSVRTKLSLAFGSLTLVVACVSAYSVKALDDSHERMIGFLKGINARVETANTVRAAVSDRAVAVRNLVLVTTPEDIQIEKAAVREAEARVESSLVKFNELVANAKDMTEDGRKLGLEIPRIEYEYRRPVALEINDLALSGQRDTAIRAIQLKCRPLLSALIKAVKDYSQTATEHSAQIVKKSNEIFILERNILIGLCILAAALAVLAGLAITRSLVSALGAEPVDLARVSHRVARGDLSPIPSAVMNAPTGSVLASMSDMQTSLLGLIGKVRTAADGIAIGSSHIAAGNVDLSSRTEELAASLQETATSMEQLTSAVKQNAENANLASSLSRDASNMALKGNEVVGEVMGKMNNIKASSTEIADIIGIIEGIAFQTNILALNAAVEAARAGEQGRGFAVVAGEVRNLAQRSSTAAKEIKELINDSVVKIHDGSLLANEAGRAMSDMTDAVSRVAGIMGEIAAASAEQGRGIGQVNLAIAQMDEVTQQNSALVEEATAASQSLQEQGRVLNESVASFVIDPWRTGVM